MSRAQGKCRGVFTISNKIFKNRPFRDLVEFFVQNVPEAPFNPNPISRWGMQIIDIRFDEGLDDPSVFFVNVRKVR
jgi:hypothetical protein